MSTGAKFDTRLLIYQSLLEIPAQVMMVDTYERLGERDVKSYIAMALLGVGSSIACVKLAGMLYENLHKDSLQGSPDTEYYISPFAAHTYDAEFSAYNHSVSSRGGQEHPLSDFLREAPAYSKNYIQLSSAQIAAKCAYGTLQADTKNPLIALLYGMSQPLGVILKDAGVVK